MKKSFLILSATSIALFYSCTRSINISSTVSETPNLSQQFDYENAKLPGNVRLRDFVTNMQFVNGMPANGGVFFNNDGTNLKPQVTNAGANLGRILFYDKKLSLNNTIACGSCHHQDKAFSDGLAVSSGFEGRKTTRSSMPLCNPVTQNNLFWDSRSKSLGDLALRPVANHIEMGMDNMDRLVSKLSATSYYADLFAKAYGDNTITKDKISDALSQFVASITTSESKFDKFLENNGANGAIIFTPLENLGHDLFNANCASCHGGDNMAPDDSPTGVYGGGSAIGAVVVEDKRGATNIGLDFVSTDNGFGDGKFKIPSLRNIALTAPYMHDGRFTNLEQVLNHYTHNIKPHPSLDEKFKGTNSSVKMIDMSATEKQAVIAFLHTLTDNVMIHDPKYSDPFKK
jgi:cytochrome c peroxidase